MNAGEFAKRRARIENEHSRRKGYAGKAMASLVKEARATLVVVEGRLVAWKLPNGQTVCKKRRYRTEPEAMLVLEGVVQMPRTVKVPVRFYHCPRCDGWHLTSQTAH